VEYRLRVFKNRVLRNIFGPKRDEVTGDWRKLHNEESNYMYPSPNNVLMIKLRRRWAGHVELVEKRSRAYRVLVGNPERKSPLGRLRHGWKDNIKIDLQEVGWGVEDGLDWSGSRLGQVAGTW
jgi:hypothetical protein